MSGISFFDTNVLVYLFDSGSLTKQKRARELLECEIKAGHAILSTQILQEFYVAVTRKLADPLDDETAERAVRDLAALPVVSVDTPMIFGAIARSRRERISFWDSLIIEAALAGGATRLYSEDLQHGRAIDGLRIENPFA